MTRIIAGASGGRRLLTPPGVGTRPTSDRVREALFSRLEHLDAIEGSVVLDLYAGSGALGLEALSRGASRVVLVEAARRAAGVARRNAIAMSRDAGRARRARDAERDEGGAAQRVGFEFASVVADRVERYLRGMPEERFDLVFIDPPYDLSPSALSDVLAGLGGWLEPDALVVLERSTRTPEPTWPTSDTGVLAPIGDRRYGETRLWFARAVRAADQPGQSRCARPPGPAGAGECAQEARPQPR